MKKNNVLNVTDLRNPDINRKNVKKQSKSSKKSIKIYSSSSDFDTLVSIPDSVPSKFVDYYVKTSLLVAQIRYNLRVLGNIEEHLLFQVEDGYVHQTLDFTLFGMTDHLYLSKDSLLRLIRSMYKNQTLLLECYLHDLDVVSTKTDDDELPF